MDTDHETACLLPLSFTLNQPTLAKGDPPAAVEWEGQMMIAGGQNKQNFTSSFVSVSFLSRKRRIQITIVDSDQRNLNTYHRKT